MLQKLNLFFKGYFNEIFTKNASEDEYWKSVIGNFLSGGLSGGAISVLSYPLEYARTRLTNDLENSKTGRPKQFNGLIDVFKKTLGSDGIRGFYRGFVIPRPPDLSRGIIIDFSTGTIIIANEDGVTSSAIISELTKVFPGTEISAGEEILIFGPRSSEGIIKAFGVREIRN